MLSDLVLGLYGSSGGGCVGAGDCISTRATYRGTLVRQHAECVQCQCQLRCIPALEARRLAVCCPVFMSAEALGRITMLRRPSQTLEKFGERKCFRPSSALPKQTGVRITFLRARPGLFLLHGTFPYLQHPRTLMRCWPLLWCPEEVEQSKFASGTLTSSPEYS